jgi:signal transduction histidine kinase
MIPSNPPSVSRQGAVPRLPPQSAIGYGLAILVVLFLPVGWINRHLLPKAYAKPLGLLLWLSLGALLAWGALRLRAYRYRLPEASLLRRLLAWSSLAFGWGVVVYLSSFFVSIFWITASGELTGKAHFMAILPLYWLKSAAVLLAIPACGWMFWHGLRRFERQRKWLAAIMVLTIVLLLSDLKLSELLDAPHDFAVGYAGAAQENPPQPSSDSKPAEQVFAEMRSIFFLLLFAISAAAGMSTAARLRNREDQLTIEKLEADVEREKTARELAEAQLKLLQAQIEPHFLFNTLGALQHRAEGKAPEAAALAADLIAFLRGSMGALREEKTTLARDGELVAAYLGVMQARLGGRLRYRVAVPAELGQQAIPTMMLLTLVENAIKHGIEPHPPGGEVLISAEMVDGKLHLTVADTGRGVSDLPGSGVGLENIRTRLKLMYGDAASLALAQHDPQGFVALLVLPVSPEGRS